MTNVLHIILLNILCDGNDIGACIHHDEEENTSQIQTRHHWVILK